MELEKQTVLITGAANGIGRAFAHEFASHHYDLVLLDIDEAELEQLAKELQQQGVTVKTIIQDLAQTNAAQTIVTQLQSQQITIDVLINNAGIGHKGAFSEIDLQANHDMLAVNIIALTELTRLVLPDMIKRNQGKIMNLSSTAAYQPGPLMATYFATKAFILSFSQALSMELEDTKVTVTALCPGPTVSSFAEAAKMQDNPIHNGSVPQLEAKDVAKWGYRVLMRGGRVSIVGILNNVMTFLARLAPTSMSMRAIYKLHKQ